MTHPMKLYPAGTPEVVRATQKDRFYTEHITSLLSDISRQLLPLRLWLRWQRELQLLAELGYYSLTTLLGNQTLGEEYCNIIQIGPSARRKYVAAGFIRRILSVLIQTIGIYSVEKGFEVLYRHIRDRRLGSLQLSEREYEVLETITGCIEDIFNSASQFHMALFYSYGIFYHFGKRLAGIKYLMIRTIDAPESMNPYKILGWLILLQLAMQMLKLCYKLLRKKKDEKIKSETTEVRGENGMKLTLEPVVKASSSRLKCPLCLEKCYTETATLCGHIFCWSCICEWTSEKSECPVCRVTVQPQQLIFLQNL